jgi:hypothetical protein
LLKIIECLDKNLLLRFPIKPAIKIIPGNLVKIKEYQGSFLTEISDGHSIIGIATNKVLGANEIRYSSIVRIFCQRAIIRTNKYDHKNKINTGDCLYCSEIGEITSKIPFEAAVPIGKAVSLSEDKKSILEFLFL